ncbi:hypothetical protein B0H10DRAFT_2061550, partial [Mycena sp. CBHHK59/15]
FRHVWRPVDPRHRTAHTPAGSLSVLKSEKAEYPEPTPSQKEVLSPAFPSSWLHL